MEEEEKLERLDLKKLSSEEILQLDEDLKKFIDYLDTEDKKLKELEDEKA
jgi:hypothetical protein